MAPATAARLVPVSRYTTQASTATTEKNNIGVSEIRIRPKNTALGEKAMRNAAAPITGGVICPPLEATASTAAARWAGKPVLFISGTLDSNTPPYQAEEMRWSMPRSMHVIVQNAGHERASVTAGFANDVEAVNP